MVVTRRNRTHHIGITENRELATCIEAISAGGASFPGFIILVGQLYAQKWFTKTNLSADTAIRTTFTGYSNDEVALEFIQHFDKHSAKSQKGAYRLLLFDGHGSHHIYEFIRYCDAHKIISFGLPPHFIHLFQSLDVVVFQPLKHYHAKALDILIRDGCENITKFEFFCIIQQVREAAFKEKTIKSAFKKTGIWPWKPETVLSIVRERQARHRTPSPPPAPSSSPFSTSITIRQINKVADMIESSLTPGETISPSFAANVSKIVKAVQANIMEMI